MKRYVHRNGETILPEVDGWYWLLLATFKGIDFNKESSASWEIAYWDNNAKFIAPAFARRVIGVYGPILPPLESREWGFNNPLWHHDKIQAWIAEHWNDDDAMMILGKEISLEYEMQMQEFQAVFEYYVTQALVDTQHIYDLQRALKKAQELPY